MNVEIFRVFSKGLKKDKPPLTLSFEFAYYRNPVGNPPIQVLRWGTSQTTNTVPTGHEYSFDLRLHSPVSDEPKEYTLNASNSFIVSDQEGFNWNEVTRVEMLDTSVIKIDGVEQEVNTRDSETLYFRTDIVPNFLAIEFNN